MSGSLAGEEGIAVLGREEMVVTGGDLAGECWHGHLVRVTGRAVRMGQWQEDCVADT